MQEDEHEDKFWLQTQNKIPNSFWKYERKFVLWVLNHRDVVRGTWKMIYICVRDKAQKWEKIHIWYELRAKSMSWVKRVNDLNQNQRTNKIFSHDLNLPFYDSSHPNLLFKSKFQNQNPKFVVRLRFESWFGVIWIRLIEEKTCFSKPCLIRVRQFCDLKQTHKLKILISLN